MVTTALRRRRIVDTRGCAWSLVLAAVAVLMFSSTAAAQADQPGPGPFSRVRLTDAGLELRVAPNQNPVLFSGTPVLLAADANGFASFTARAIVQGEGARLVQGGEIAGQTLAAFFREGSPRMIQVTNGDGRVTQLEVIRTGADLQVVYLDRALSRKQVSFVSTSLDDFDAREDRLAQITLPPGPTAASTAVAFTIAVSLPPFPDGASHQEVSVQGLRSGGLNGTGGGGVTSNLSDPLLFVHMMIPRGLHSLTMTHSIYFDLTPTRRTRVATSHLLATDLSVEKGGFFAFTPPDLPPLVDASMSFEGLEQFDATPAAPLTVTATLTGVGAPIVVDSTVELIAPSSPTIDLMLPAGDYETTLVVGIAGTGPNSGGYSSSLSVGTQTARASMVLSIPPLVRLTGTVLDPDFELVPSGGQNGFRVSHGVSFIGETGGALSYEGSAQLLGFQRGFRMLAPPGAVGRMRGFFQVSLGDEPAPGTSSENESGYLILPHLSEEFAVTTDQEINITVPRLPQHVTVEGRVLDAQGRGARYAYVSAYAPALAGFDDAEFSAGVIADRHGKFRLRLLPSDGYTISVSAPRFRR